MKSSYLRYSAALLLTVALAACGGKESFSVTGSLTNASGVVTPLGNSGLVLENNGDTVSPAAGATSFTFPKTIDYGTEFDITVKTQPNHMTCSVLAGGSGSAGHNVAIAATVGCTQNTFTLGGTISGMTVAGLVLSNGAVSYTPAVSTTPATPFTYSFDSVPVGNTYNVVVQTNPTGFTCTVANGVGIMGDLPAAAATDTTITSPVMNVNVTCTAN